MKAILLAAGGVKNVSSVFLPGKTEKHPDFSLEWILHALSENHIHDISLVGGQDIEQVSAQYPHLSFYLNPFWKKTGMVESLFASKEKLKGRCLISYADIVYRPSTLKKALQSFTEDIAVVTDTKWKTRYAGRSRKAFLKAEKIIVRNGCVTHIARNLDDADGEFCGVVLLTENGVKLFHKVYEERKALHRGRFHEAASFKKANLTDFLQEIILRGKPVQSLRIEGDWAELDAPQDLANFVFGTKSVTLRRLKPLLKHGKILEQVSFTVKEWRKNKYRILQKVQETLSAKHVIVRSSSLTEDARTASHAGMFASILHVPKHDAKALESAVASVIQSYKDTNELHQIFIQPQIKDAALSGVLFTCDIRTGAPYYVINYDTSGSTVAVTSAQPGQTHLWYIYKKAQSRLKNRSLSRLIQCAEELETLTGSETIDMEFAIDKKGKLFIFQVRPLTITEAIARYYEYNLESLIHSTKLNLKKQLSYKPHIAGKISALGDMPDWNPAEMIGTQPKPLTYSLYNYLIMESAWRVARGHVGYFNPHSEKLMVNVCGHPYVDIRSSLNNLTPDALSFSTRDKLVTHCLHYLKNHPDAHDKLEFEVTATCYTPDFELFAARLKKEGFTKEEVKEIRKTLYELTCSILTGKTIKISELLANVKELELRRINFIRHKKSFSTPELIQRLLDDCIYFGTIPFAVLARYAFIGSTFMRSFVNEGILSQETYHAFFESIHTIAKDLSHSLDKVKNGKMIPAAFLKNFGHLRPGTYDIQSETYDENPDLYFGAFAHKQSCGKNEVKLQTSADYSFTKIEYEGIKNILRKYNIPVSPEQLFRFVRESVEGRERAKFIFTKNVSHALKEIVGSGGQMNLSREDLAFLNIYTLLHGSDFTNYKHIIENAKQEYSLHQQVILPSLIFSPEDVEKVCFLRDRPNFITSKSITAPALLLESPELGMNLNGKIILIESADPGYDWIFTHGIAGLVTKYGGAASHMTIRCAEFGLPAAVGCGVRIFEELKTFPVIRLDCEKKTAQGITT